MRERDHIQKLLRLKRYERPADPDYFDKFLDEFRARQRTELFRTPLRQMLLERIQALLVGFEVPRYAYAATTALFILFGGSILLLPGLQQPDNSGQQLVASGNQIAPVSDKPIRLSSATQSGMILSGLEFSEGRIDDQRITTQMASLPHYVLDSTPASYEPPFSF